MRFFYPSFLGPFFRVVTICFLFVFAFVFQGSALASGPSRVMLRDAETEEAIKTWSEGAIRAAGLSPAQVHIVLVQDSSVNAFVAGGPNIFIHTGLLLKTENAGEVVGVVAHELGHIAGGHLIRTREVGENASLEALLGTVLGIGVAVASGDGAAAVAGAQIGRGAALSRFLSHSRVQESSADQAGFRYLSSSGLNPSGLVTFLDKLSSEELLPASEQSVYVRTHPLSRDRIEALKTRVSASPLRSATLPSGWEETHARIKAKLLAYVFPQQVLYAYKSSDSSIPALYARAVSAYRLGHVKEALDLADQLTRREPRNPYFHELKGQMLFEFGQVKNSIASYEKAVSLMPSSGLIRIALAQSLIESSQDLPQAIVHLKRAEQDEPKSSRIKRLLATAYGRLGKETEAQVYLAEEALMLGDHSRAVSMAEAVLAKLSPSSPEAVRARDVINSVGVEGKKN